MSPGDWENFMNASGVEMAAKNAAKRCVNSVSFLHSSFPRDVDHDYGDATSTKKRG